MIDVVPRPLPPHLNHEKSRHGKRVWKVRVGKGPRITLKCQVYDTQEFWAEYRAAIEGATPPAKKNAPPVKESLAWLIARYRDSSAWTQGLEAATRKQRENIFKQVIKTGGHEPAAAIDRKHIIAGIERRAHTPSQARHFLDAMRGLFEWAVGAEHVPLDPTIGVKPPARPKTDGFKKWTVEEVEKYRERWPLGTRQRVWLEVLLNSGLRRGDAVQFGRQHVRKVRLDDGAEVEVASMRVEKGRKKQVMVVTFLVLPRLRQAIDAGPVGELAFICGEGGGPLVKESFGNNFSDAAREAGIHKSAHGVRKIAATITAESGVTEAELEAMFGWVRGSRVARIYTEEVNRAKLGIAAGLKLAGTHIERNSPTPKVQPPAPQKKASGANKLERRK